MHTVDYAAFKRMLRHFLQRRAQLRDMLSASADDKILEIDLHQILGPPPDHPKLAAQSVLLPTRKSSTTELINLDESNATTSYVPFIDSKTSRTYTVNGGTNSVVANTAAETTTMVNALPAIWDQDLSSACGEYDHGVPHLLNLEKGARRLKRRAVMRQVSNFERNDLVVFLAHEMDKVAMFYLAQWQRLSQQLLDYNLHQQDMQQQQLGTRSHARDPQLVELGQEILELEAFSAINIITIRQMLIRYDAFARSFEGTPMLAYYMKMIKSDKSMTSFRKLLQHEEVHALAESFLGLCEDNLELATKFQLKRQEFQHVLESSERAEATSSTGHAMALQDTLLQNLRYYFLLGLIEDRIGYEPAYLTSRGNSLTQEMQILADWREEDHLTKQLQKGQEKDELPRQQIFNLTMALLAAFLYCMNYYIVEPSSTMYVNALGSHDAMSGALIGMMPIASFMSAIFFSIWTNHSFRQPFLMSCALLLSGNILYSAAYNFKSIEMALAGRFLTGLGGPKCIIRRYMADTTSLNLRTSVNAGFGMVVAAGSALGPGCAILLNKLDFAIPIPNGEIWLNGMTGPGYFMALLWTIFSIALYVEFREPDRSGLEEQKRMEAETSPSPKSEHSTSPPTSPHEFDRDMKSVQVGISKSVSHKEDDLMTIFSGTTANSYERDWTREEPETKSCWAEAKRLNHLVTFPVRICLGLLFAKVFVIETLVSATSALTKNRYEWQVQQVGTLGCINGLFVIPLSVLVGRLSMSYQDRALMVWLLAIGLFGVLLLIDISDLITDESKHYNEDHWLAVHPPRYVIGYFLTYISIQSFEGVIGSALSKLIPTALASGTLNSGLLATLVDTFGRSCGDLFISLVGFINLRQLMNLLFIPGAIILITCLMVVRRHYDLLAV
jgi:hypothetical protein